MAITEHAANSQSVTTDEWSLTTDTTNLATDTTDGVFQCFLDLNAVVAGDEFRFRVYEKVQAADTQRIVYQATFIGGQSPPIFVTPSLILMHGWDMSLERLAGADRTITWSIRKVA